MALVPATCATDWRLETLTFAPPSPLCCRSNAFDQVGVMGGVLHSVLEPLAQALRPVGMAERTIRGLTDAALEQGRAVEG